MPVKTRDAELHERFVTVTPMQLRTSAIISAHRGNYCTRIRDTSQHRRNRGRKTWGRPIKPEGCDRKIYLHSETFKNDISAK